MVLDMLILTSFSAEDAGLVDIECIDSEEETEDCFPWEIKGRLGQGPRSWLGSAAGAGVCRISVAVNPRFRWQRLDSPGALGLLAFVFSLVLTRKDAGLSSGAFRELLNSWRLPQTGDCCEASSAAGSRDHISSSVGAGLMYGFDCDELPVDGRTFSWFSISHIDCASCSVPDGERSVLGPRARRGGGGRPIGNSALGAIDCDSTGDTGSKSRGDMGSMGDSMLARLVVL